MCSSATFSAFSIRLWDCRYRHRRYCTGQRCWSWRRQHCSSYLPLDSKILAANCGCKSSAYKRAQCYGAGVLGSKQKESKRQKKVTGRDKHTANHGSPSSHRSSWGCHSKHVHSAWRFINCSRNILVHLDGPSCIDSCKNVEKRNWRAIKSTTRETRRKKQIIGTWEFN